MLLKRRIRAGIMLYALLLTAVFALVLQFYLGRLQSRNILRQAQHQQITAQLMAELTRAKADADRGEFQFSQGQTHYRHQGDLFQVQVWLADDGFYQFDFFKKAVDKEEPQAEETTQVSLSESLSDESEVEPQDEEAIDDEDDWDSGQDTDEAIDNILLESDDVDGIDAVEDSFEAVDVRDELFEEEVV